MINEICHVCGKVKKPYTVIIGNDIMSLMQYEDARAPGPICKRCDQYFIMTGKFEDVSKKEFKLAKDAKTFSNLVYRFWFRNGIDNEVQEWPGTDELEKWYRKNDSQSNR